MLTQLATQVSFATQTIDYSNDFLSLSVSCISLVGLAASMIVLAAVRPRFASTLSGER